jgi:lysophospholipase L1-like esterase
VLRAALGFAVLTLMTSTSACSRKPDYHYVGRFEQTSKSARFAWSGSSISARVRATTVSAELGESAIGNYFYVVVDGKPRPEKLITKPGRREYVLASGLPAGEHQITLHRLTEAWLGETEFFGFKLDAAGKFLSYGQRPTRRIEVIGDSISAGYGNEGTDKDCPFTPAQQNHYLTYAAIAARRLQADLVTVAWSGKGVFNNRGSTTDFETMPLLWQRTLPERSDSKWSFTSPEPHAVVINLGTNDLAEQNPDWTPYAAAYLKFLGEVRARYASADVFCALGPMLSDGKPEDPRHALSSARAGIQSALSERRRAGDQKLHFLEFPEQNAQVGYGCDWHPNLEQHRLMAALLEAELKAKLGW